MNILDAIKEAIVREPWRIRLSQFMNPESILPAVKEGMARGYHSTHAPVDEIISGGLRTGRSLDTAESAPVVFGTTRPNVGFGPNVVAFDVPLSDAIMQGNELRVGRNVAPNEIVGQVPVNQWNERGIRANWPESRWRQEYADYVSSAVSKGIAVDPEILRDAGLIP